MMKSFPIWRSMLFLPAHIEKFVAKAHTRGADAYILDLEDSVPASAKEEARLMVAAGAAQVSQSGAAAIVRINQPWAMTELDLQAVVGTGVNAIVLPKVNDPDYVRDVTQKIAALEAQRDMRAGHTLLIAQIEDVAALPRLDDIATSSPRLMGMILGSEDFSATAGMEPIPAALFGPNQQVLFACRRAGILPMGFPASIADYSNAEEFRATIKLARQLGFVGAFCIHPSQVSILNEEFMPTPQEVEYAQGVISAYAQAAEEGRGAVEFKGKMIDPPVVARAQELLRRVRSMAVK
ncbi:MAG: CoA ester lyase [Sterolibacterium sp.]